MAFNAQSARAVLTLTPVQVTSYLNDHPGGAEIIHDLAGEDATEDYDDVGHSEEAHEMLKKFHIGDIGASSSGPSSSSSSAPATTATVVSVPKSAPATSAASSSSSSSSASVYEPPKPRYNPVSGGQINKGPALEDDNSSTMLVVGALAAAALAAGFYMYRKSQST